MPRRGGRPRRPRRGVVVPRREEVGLGFIGWPRPGRDGAAGPQRSSPWEMPPYGSRSSYPARGSCATRCASAARRLQFGASLLLGPVGLGGAPLQLGASLLLGPPLLLGASLLLGPPRLLGAPLLLGATLLQLGDASRSASASWRCSYSRGSRLPRRRDPARSREIRWSGPRRCSGGSWVTGGQSPSSGRNVRPGAVPDARSASMACCRMITAAAWSMMGRCFLDDFPAERSACWALTVDIRSSTSRTCAPAAARRSAKAIASSVDAVGCARQRERVADDELDRLVLVGELEDAADVASSPSALRATVSTGTASTPAGVAARHADAAPADVDAEPRSGSRGHRGSPTAPRRAPRGSRPRRCRRPARGRACRLRRRRAPAIAFASAPAFAPASRAAGVGRDDRERLAADLAASATTDAASPSFARTAVASERSSSPEPSRPTDS